MSQRSLSAECTYFKLQCLHRVMTRYYDGHLAGSGLKGSQLALLTSIKFLQPVRPSDLATQLHLDNSTITRTLRTMRERDLVSCLPEVDERSRLIELTEAGQLALTRARRHWRQAQSTMAEQMGASDINELHELMDRFTEKLDEGL